MIINRRVCLYLSIVAIIFVLSCLFHKQANVTDFRSIKPQKRPKIIEEAESLLVKNFRQRNNNYALEAKNKLSAWLVSNKNNRDQKLVAQVLRLRGNSYTLLSDQNSAIDDYKESLKYDLVPQMQAVICSLEEEQVVLFNVQECYARAVALFKKNRTPRYNIDYSLARILSGEGSAFTDFRNGYLMSSGVEKKLFKMTAVGFFDKADYKKITGENKKE